MPTKQQLTELQDENLSLRIGKDAALEAYTTLYADYQRLQEQVLTEKTWSEKKSEHILILQPRILELEADVSKLLGFVRHSINFASQPFDTSELPKTEAREILERLEPKVHYCIEWDYLLIRPEDVKFKACLCYKE